MHVIHMQLHKCFGSVDSKVSTNNLSRKETDFYQIFRTNVLLILFLQYIKSKSVSTYRKVSSSNTSCLEAHAGFFRLLMNDIFDPNILWPFPNCTRDRNVLSGWFLAGNQVNHQNFNPSLLTNNLWRVVRLISDQSLCKYLNVKYVPRYLPKIKVLL